MFGGILVIRVGYVKSVDEKKCKARVLYKDTGLLSAELQIAYRSSFKNKDYWMPDIEEQVLVAVTDQSVGYIIASLYSDVDQPPVQDKNKRHITFKDGTVIEYDTSSSTLYIDCKGPINIKATGNINVQGDVIADGISLKTHTHPGVESPSGGG